MAGSVLGQDQVKKVNSLYAKIRSHIANLVEGSPSPVDLMRVHVLTEHLDTTELSRIFMELPFLSPAEKRALVRVAIFDVLIGSGSSAIVVSADAKVDLDALDHPRVLEVQNTETALKAFTPPQFKLNVATAEAVKTVETNIEEKQPEKAPAVLTKLSDLRKDAREKHDAAESARQEAVNEIRNQQIDAANLSATPGFKLNVAKVEDHQGK